MGELRSSKLLEVMEASVLYKLIDEKWKKWKELVWKDGPTKIRYITAVSRNGELCRLSEIGKVF
jgi:hypothetical protein